MMSQQEKTIKRIVEKHGILDGNGGIHWTRTDVTEACREAWDAAAAQESKRWQVWQQKLTKEVTTAIAEWIKARP